MVEASDALLNMSPDTWGEALLRTGADLVLDALVSRARQGDFTPVDILREPAD